MNATLKISSATAALLALTACGGSGGGGGGTELLDDPSFGQLGRAIDATADELGLLEEGTELQPASPDDLLVPGSATYVGQVAVVIGDSIDDPNAELLSDSDILGQVELDVSFTNSGGTLSGTMQDFVGSDGEDYDGTVDIAEGNLVVDATSVAVATTVSGTITDEDGFDAVVDGDMIGAFAEGDVFVGAAFGDISTDQGTDDFVGIIIAED